MKINLNEVRQLIRKEVVTSLVKEAVMQSYLFEQDQSRDEKNKDLIRRHKDGDPSALNQFVKDNAGLVATIARSFRSSSNLPLEDLMQAGYEGLITAVDKFDAEKENANVGSTMSSWIKSMIVKQLELERPVSVKGKGGRDIRKIKTGYNKRFRELKSELMRDPTDEEMADSLDVDIELMKSVRGVGGTSTSTPVGEEGGQTIGDSLTYQNQLSPEDAVMQQDFTNLLSRFSDNLTKTADKLAIEVLKGNLTNQEAANKVSEETGADYTRQAMNLRVNKVKDMLVKFLGADAIEYQDSLERNAAA